jgi:hypothetical protein
MPRMRPRPEEVTIVKNLLWFLLGIAGGVVVAHFVNRDPRGHEVLAQVDARITEFTDRIGSAYREQEARFSGPLSEVRDADASDSGGETAAAPAAASDIPTPADVAAIVNSTDGGTDDAATDGPRTSD